jgi:hypothetical protein
VHRYTISRSSSTHTNTIITTITTSNQGLTLVHFQRKRFLWDGGRVKGLIRGCFEMLGVLGDVHGVFLFRKRLRLS